MKERGREAVMSTDNQIQSENTLLNVPSSFPLPITPSPHHPTSPSLLRAIPTLITFGLLAAVGWFGHHTDWKLTQGTDRAAAKHTTDGITPNPVVEHPAPRWCAIHGVAECPVHQPDVAQVPGTPKPPQYDTVVALKLLSRQENNRHCPRVARHIGFESAEAFEKQNIDVDVVGERPMVESLRVNGEVVYDQTQVAHLSTRAAGTVWRIFKTLGDEVKAGEIIGLVDALAVGKAKAELATAVVQKQLRQRTWESLTRAKGVVPDRQVREAESAFEESQIGVITAQQALVNYGFEVPDNIEKLGVAEMTRMLRCLGLSDDLCESLSAKKSMTMNLIPITAPQDGVIVEMDVVAGEVIQPEKSLLTLAGLSRMWLTLHVKQEDERLVSLGQSVKFKADGGRQEAAGRVAWISPSVDERTRTLKVRAVLANQDRTLRANSFGTGWIVLREEPKAVTVPLDALQTDGDCQIVFVRDKNFLKKDGPKVFHPRQVRVGAKNDQFVELLAGVLPGEVVATRGSVALRAELLKER